jgi:DNA ligase-1
VGRTDNIMKLKKHDDAEAVVIAHIEGKGKYQGILGAIQVKTDEGIIFKIGSGFTDKERHQPPAIGSLITFKYNGKTQAGIPRFARYFRIREQSAK